MNIYIVTTLNFFTKRSEVDHCYFKEEDAQRRTNELNDYYIKTTTPKIAVVIERYIH